MEGHDYFSVICEISHDLFGICSRLDHSCPAWIIKVDFFTDVSWPTCDPTLSDHPPFIFSTLSLKKIGTPPGRHHMPSIWRRFLANYYCTKHISSLIWWIVKWLSSFIYPKTKKDQRETSYSIACTT
jgi:hypothetical protein